MPQTNEEKLDAGLAVLEMSRTRGWKWLEERIQTELRIEYVELREFEVSGKTAEQIAAEYLQHRAAVNSYEKIMGMVVAAINEKDEAAEAMNRE
jgi:hypothetical protein